MEKSYLASKIDLMVVKKGSSLATVIISTVVLVTFVVGGGWYYFSEFKKTPACQAAIAYIEKDPKVLEKTGDIIGYGFIVSGEISTKGDGVSETGNAFFNITVKGEKENAEVMVFVSKHPGEDWKTLKLTVKE